MSLMFPLEDRIIFSMICETVILQHCPFCIFVHHPGMRSRTCRQGVSDQYFFVHHRKKNIAGIEFHGLDSIHDRPLLILGVLLFFHNKLPSFDSFSFTASHEGSILRLAKGRFVYGMRAQNEK